ncbi:hypothetical protein [Enterocloster bolteae]|uniref:hypothetical protein n=1 Tax=Enterocloster bolteae TaxID=208479 RepID=UPI00210B8259|nr:hypothetical protein [Enterocloster bolteae]MCQ5146136.1 hypothetical protein [Enterocloster bolteae]
MIKLIQAACQWGQKDFDGWVIGKARYCFHRQSEPASYESMPKKTAPGYVLLEITAYDTDRQPCQSLEICLVDTKALRNTGRAMKAGDLGDIEDSGAARHSGDFRHSADPRHSAVPRYMPDQLTMAFPQKHLESFLAASGDTNPIHYGPDAVIPGLWILNRLEGLYGSRSPAETLSIRFLHPVHAGGSVRLVQKNNIVTGTMGSITCFTMSIHTPDQTQKRR